MKKRYEYAIIFLGGGLYYFLLEVLWRGYSHYTMVLLGGACAISLYYINNNLKSIPFPARWLLCTFVITLLELAAGIIINIWLGLTVWDYSDIPFNFIGQISVRSSLIWLVLCVPTTFICRIINKLFSLSREHYE